MMMMMMRWKRRGFEDAVSVVVVSPCRLDWAEKKPDSGSESAGRRESSWLAVEVVGIFPRTTRTLVGRLVMRCEN
jgi:hypothetical protein